MYVSACNYDPEAILDDGSCEFTTCAGCTYEWSLNYDPTALIDDGSCEEEIAEDPCYGDLNGDSVVSSIDLLGFLSAYGSTCGQ